MNVHVISKLKHFHVTYFNHMDVSLACFIILNYKVKLCVNHLNSAAVFVTQSVILNYIKAK
jgi:hypothetical protein